MKSFGLYARGIAVATIICFFGIMDSAALPRLAETTASAPAVSQAPAGDAPGYIVKESAPGQARKKPRSLLPWIVAGGVAAAVVLVLLLTKKKGNSDVTVTEFDSQGAANGIALDDTGNVYVSDTGGNSIKKFTANGVFIKKWGLANGSYPTALTVCGRRLFALGNTRLQVFDLEGNHETSWDFLGYAGATSGKDVDADGAGNVYIVCSTSGDFEDEVIVLNSAGSLLRHWNGVNVVYDRYTWRSIAISGNLVFLVDNLLGQKRIHVFDLDGHYIRTIGTPGHMWYAPMSVAIMNGGSLIVGGAMAVYDADVPDDPQIQKYDFNGNDVGVIRPAQGNFNPVALAVNGKAGKIYICHGKGGKILVVDTF